MVNIPYYERIQPNEQELDALAQLGHRAEQHGYKSYNNIWYYRIGTMGVSDEVFEESKKRPLTIEEIHQWPEK